MKGISIAIKIGRKNIKISWIGFKQKILKLEIHKLLYKKLLNQKE
jgi:hypothetical protein